MRNKLGNLVLNYTVQPATILFLVASCELGPSLKVDRTYPTHQAAVDAGALHGNSFIPWFTPKSATEIHDVHDADVNTGHGTFRFDPKNAEDFRTALQGREKPPAGSEVRPKSTENTYIVEDFLVYVDWSNGECRYWLRLDR